MNKFEEEINKENEARILRIEKSIDNSLEKAINKRIFEEKEREKLSKIGQALPDGSFPIRNTQDLKDAIKSIGRAKDYGKAKSWIIKRARALGELELLPEDWSIHKSMSLIKRAFEAGSISEEMLEKAMGHKYFKREGTPGKYKYYYTEKEYKEAKGVNKKYKNLSDEKIESIIIDLGQKFDDKIYNEYLKNKTIRNSDEFKAAVKKFDSKHSLFEDLEEEEIRDTKEFKNLMDVMGLSKGDKKEKTDSKENLLKERKIIESEISKNKTDVGKHQRFMKKLEIIDSKIRSIENGEKKKEHIFERGDSVLVGSSNMRVIGYNNDRLMVMNSGGEKFTLSPAQTLKVEKQFNPKEDSLKKKKENRTFNWNSDDSKILKKFGIDENHLTFNGNLDLRGSKITSLPENLKVMGHLDLRNTKITSLPENLTVIGNLDARNTKITSVSENLIVGSSLDLQDTKITSLPKNITVGSHLYLRNTKITSLPENLTVGGSLYLRGSEITSLPENFNIKGSLDLKRTKITSLPKNLKVGGILDLRETGIIQSDFKDSAKISNRIFLDKKEEAKGDNSSIIKVGAHVFELSKHGEGFLYSDKQGNVYSSKPDESKEEFIKRAKRDIGLDFKNIK